MRLFVWENVLVNYGPGIMFVFAHTVGEARNILAYAEDSFAHNEDYSEWREWWIELDDEDRDLHACYYRVWIELESEPRVIEEPEGWVFHGSD